MAGTTPRLPPLGNTFWNYPMAVGSAKRSRSYAGYMSYAQRQSRVQQPFPENSQSAAPQQEPNTADVVPILALATQTEGMLPYGAGRSTLPGQDEGYGQPDKAEPSTPTTTRSHAWEESSSCSSMESSMIERRKTKSPPPSARSRLAGDAARERWADATDETSATHLEPRPAPRETACSGATLPAGVTTLMLQNLPLRMGQSEAMNKLDRLGFKGLYDFFYLPRSFSTGLGGGYAFLNMVNEAAAQRVVDELGAYRGGAGRGGSNNNTFAPRITVAHIQGRDGNMRKWCTAKMLRVKNASFRPFCLVGDEVPAFAAHATQKAVDSTKHQGTKTAQKEVCWFRIAALPQAAGSFAEQLVGKFCTVQGVDEDQQVASASVVMGDTSDRRLIVTLPLRCLTPVPAQVGHAAA